MWELQEAGAAVFAGLSGQEQHHRHSEHPTDGAVLAALQELPSPEPLTLDGSSAINREPGGRAALC